MKLVSKIFFVILIFTLVACENKKEEQQETPEIIKPVIVTDTVQFDSDDPAIWINKENPAESIIFGTDKEENGGLYAFDLQGKIIKEKVIHGLNRPNNVDITYDVPFGDGVKDIAIVTLRNSDSLRIFSVPDMQPVDGGGFPAFEGDSVSSPMGISIYNKEADNSFYAVVSRKSGPSDNYLWQYEISYNPEKDILELNKVREFGKWSGLKEIEAIAVDSKAGKIYYSDEGFGVREYYADPDSGNTELSVFGKTGFTRDHEGISIYETSDTTGYIIVSDQEVNKFQIFRREGNHELYKVVQVEAMESDGNEVSNFNFGEPFTKGIFVAMSTDKTFHYYKIEDIIGE